MAKSNEEKYSELVTYWELFVADKIQSGILSYLKNDYIKNPIEKRRLIDSIYDVLTKNKYDTVGFDFIYNAVKLERPGLTRDAYLKEFTRTKVLSLDTRSLKNRPMAPKKANKINLFNNIDNERTSIRIGTQIQGQLSILEKRVSRLDGYLKSIDIDGSLNDVGRIINTFKTQEVGLSRDLSRQRRRYKNSVGIDRKRELKSKIKDLNKQLKTAKKQRIELNKKFNKFDRNKDTYPNKKRLSEYKNLVESVKSNILGDQQSSVLKDIISKSTSKIKSIAQTEKTRALSMRSLDSARSINRESYDVSIVISLDPTHDIIDICDDMHGTYDIDDLPSEGLPPYHPNCQCKTTIKKTKKRGD